MMCMNNFNHEVISITICDDNNNNNNNNDDDDDDKC